MEELQQTLKCRAQAALNLLHEGICRTEQKLEQCLHVLADVQEDVRQHQEAQAYAIQDDYNKKLQQLTENFEQQVLVLQQQTQAYLADLQDSATVALQQAAQALLQQLQLEQLPQLLEQAAQLRSGPSQGSEICAEVSLACLALHKQVLQDLQQAKQGQLKPALLSELLVPRPHDNHHADGQQAGVSFQAEQGYSCDGSVTAASEDKSPSDCSGLHSPGRCMSAAAGDTSSTWYGPEDVTAQHNAKCDVKWAAWGGRDAASDTHWGPLHDQVEFKRASADQQQGPDATLGWLVGENSVQQQQRHQQQQCFKQPGSTLRFQPQQLAFASSPSAEGLLPAGSNSTAIPLHTRDSVIGPYSQQLPFGASKQAHLGRCGSAGWVAIRQHASASRAGDLDTGSSGADAGRQVASNTQLLLRGPGRPSNSNSMHKHGPRPRVSDWVDHSKLHVGEQLQPAGKLMFSTPASTLQLIRPGQEQHTAYTAPNRQPRVLSSLPAQLPPSSSNGTAKPVLRRCVSGEDADAASVVHTAAVLRSTASTRRQLESSWRQGLAKAAGKASAAPASLDELRAVSALDSKMRGVSRRRASLAVGSMSSGSESDESPRRQLQPRRSARHSQPKRWSHLVREQVLQPDRNQDSEVCLLQSTHTLQAAAVAVGPPSGITGWPARKAGALSGNSSTPGRLVASSALDLLD